MEFEIAQLRHMYAQMINGCVKDSAAAKRIAEGLLAPVIEGLERVVVKRNSQPLIIDSQGTLRFQKNALVDALYEHGVRTGFGLNELHRMDFSDEDRQQFAQLIGYSLSGYGTLTYCNDEAHRKVNHDNKQ